MNTNLRNRILIAVVSLFLIACQEGEIESISQYKNHSEGTKYVEQNECKKCHLEIYNSFQSTEMGHSFSKGKLENSAANFHNQQPIFDTLKNLFYLPFTKDSLLYLKEYRLNKKGDTIFQRVEKLDFIIGSGQHTNSHLISQNGYIYQAPLTFYTQKGEWHLPPGFENGNNTRFSRTIGQECMTCHNGYAEYVAGSKNKFEKIPEGIDCERCHGPGEVHVKEKMEGKIIDITKEIDYSIVNPAKLSSDLQMDVCQRCHLQGISALKEGKSYYDFIPGMKLNSMYELYQARFKDSEENFIMASHSDRLQMSNCFLESRKNETQQDLTCITCHNPHVSVRNVKSDYFNSKCIECHQEKKCTETVVNRALKKENCIECHMKKASAYDIPHVSITDHNITARPISRNINLAEKPQSDDEKQKDFIQLFCRTNDNPSPLSSAKAYLNYFEKYTKNSILLDSAEYYLKASNEVDSILNKYFVRLYFLRGNYKKVIAYAQKPLAKDAWTYYRIGQSYFNTNDLNNSIFYFQKTVKLAPLDIEFNNKLASAYMDNKLLDKAKIVLENNYINNPKIAETNNLLGFCIVSLAFEEKENIGNAKKYFLQAVQLNPDFTKAQENLASYYLNVGNKEKAAFYIQILLEKDEYNLTYQKFKKVAGLL